MRFSTKKVILFAVLSVLVAATLVFAGMRGKLYVKDSGVQLTERSGLVCQNTETNFCERNYRCPDGMVGYGLIYNMKEEEGHKALGGLSLLCSDPNAMDQLVIVGASGDAFAGEEIKDYCPMGYLLAGAEFYTTNRTELSGARRVCRRYQPRDERTGPNIIGEGFDRMLNVCTEDHWVTGLKISFNRQQDENGYVDSNLMNVRFYCSEVRHYLLEPEEDDSGR